MYINHCLWSLQLRKCWQFNYKSQKLQTQSGFQVLFFLSSLTKTFCPNFTLCIFYTTADSSKSCAQRAYGRLVVISNDTNGQRVILGHLCKKHNYCKLMSHKRNRIFPQNPLTCEILWSEWAGLLSNGLNFRRECRQWACANDNLLAPFAV